LGGESCMTNLALKSTDDPEGFGIVETFGGKPACISGSLLMHRTVLVGAEGEGDHGYLL